MSSPTYKIPVAALILGLGGLLPFFTGALMAAIPATVSSLAAPWLPEQATGAANSVDASVGIVREWGLRSLGAYGAVILSFLGGVRWGNLLPRQEQTMRWGPLTMSVVPSLIAWPALLLSPVWMLLVLVSGFILQYALDLKAVQNNILPAWFGRLRLMLTTGAVLSLLAGLLAV